MRSRSTLLGAGLLAGCVLATAGCHSHPLTDYRPLDKAGMGSSYLQELKGLDTSDAEVAQLVKLEQARVHDDLAVALVSTAHDHHHPFASADSVASLAGAGFADLQVMEIANADKLDVLSGDVVTLRLIGLSDATVQMLLDRHLQSQPVLSSGEIARLKNTGLTEKQIVDRINQGMTDEQAEKEIYVRETIRNHSNTGFVRTRGRRH
jgi:hypothetical protein